MLQSRLLLQKIRFALKRGLSLWALGVCVSFCLTACPSSRKSDPTVPVTAPPAAPLASGATSLGGGGGGQDGGGGEIASSKPEDVVEALESARQFLMSKHVESYLQTAIQSAKDYAALTPNDLARIRFPKGLTKDLNFKKVAEVLARIESPNASYKSIAEYLKLSPVRFEKNDTLEKNCSTSPENRYPDAFVNGFDYGAEVCFNIQKLTRVPKDGLKQHALALWFHELSHVNGIKDEAIANDIENFLLWNTFSETQRALEGQTEILVERAMAVYKSIDAIHEFHVHKKEKEAELAQFDSVPLTESFDHDTGLASGRIEALGASMNALIKLQSGFIFQKAYADVSSEIDNFRVYYEKLEKGFSALLSETDVESGSADENKKSQARWDEFRFLAFCVANSAHKVSEVSSLSGLGTSGFGIALARDEHDAKNCDRFKREFSQAKSVRAEP